MFSLTTILMIRTMVLLRAYKRRAFPAQTWKSSFGILLFLILIKILLYLFYDNPLSFGDNSLYFVKIFFHFFDDKTLLFMIIPVLNTMYTQIVCKYLFHANLFGNNLNYPCWTLWYNVLCVHFVHFVPRQRFGKYLFLPQWQLAKHWNHQIQDVQMFNKTKSWAVQLLIRNKLKHWNHQL